MLFYPREKASELIAKYGREALTEARWQHDVCIFSGAVDEATKWDQVYVAILNIVGLPREDRTKAAGYKVKAVFR